MGRISGQLFVAVAVMLLLFECVFSTVSLSADTKPGIPATDKVFVMWSATPQESVEEEEIPWTESASGTVYLISEEDFEREKKREEQKAPAVANADTAKKDIREAGILTDIGSDSGTQNTSVENNSTAGTENGSGQNKQEPALESAPAPSAPEPQWKSAQQVEKETRTKGNTLSVAAESVKETLGLQSLTGSVTWGRQVVDLGGTHQRIEDLPASFSYNAAYRKQVAESKNLDFTFTHNNQDMTINRTATLQTGVNYSSPKFNIAYSKNNTDNMNSVPTGGSTENSNYAEQLNIAINAIKKAPIQVGIQKTTTSSGQDGTTSSENRVSVFNFSVAPEYFKKIKPVFTYSTTDTDNVLQNSSTKNDVMTLNLNYQVSERIVLKSMLQNTSVTSLPADPAQKTVANNNKQSYGLEYKYSPSLTFSTDVAYDIDDNFSQTAGAARSKRRQLIHGVTLSKGIYSLKTTFTTNDTGGGTDVRDKTVTLGLNPDSKFFKNTSITLSDKETHDADSLPQNDNERVTVSSNFDIRAHLKLAAQYTLVMDERFGANGSANTTNRNTTRAYTLSNPLGKNLTQTFTLQKNVSSQDTAGSVTDTFNHVVRNNWSRDFLGRALTLNMSHNFSLTQVEPAGDTPGQDTENRVLTLAMGYQLMKPLKFDYTYIKNRNSISSVTNPDYNYTAQNNFALNYQIEAGGTAALKWDYSNSKNGDKANVLVFNYNMPAPGRKTYLFSLNRAKKEGDKQVNLQMGVTYNF